MTSTREQQLLARIASMEKNISGLTSTITKMNEQHNSLQDEVIMLKKRVSILESINIVSSKTSTTLQRQLETQQQYSRRNCMVIDNIKADKQEDEASLTAKVAKIVETLEPGCHAEFDKVHRIGPVKDGLQSTIVRFTKHSTIRKIYNKRKSQNSYLFKPSLTNFRRKELKKANNIMNGSRDKSFVFADILGNLKVRFEKPLKGRYVHEFYDCEDLMDLIIDQEYDAYEL